MYVVLLAFVSLLFCLIFLIKKIQCMNYYFLVFCSAISGIQEYV